MNSFSMTTQIATLRFRLPEQGFTVLQPKTSTIKIDPKLDHGSTTSEGNGVTFDFKRMSRELMQEAPAKDYGLILRGIR